MATPATSPAFPGRLSGVTALFEPNPDSAVTGVLQKILNIDRLNEWLDQLRQSADGRSIFDRATDLLNLELRMDPADLARIPKSGPVVVTANHPFGLIEGMLIGKALQEVRPDIKFMANFLLERVPELRPHCVFVDPFGGKDAKLASRRGLAESVRWLREDGGVLVVFPAGEVAHMDFKRREITDPAWNPSMARLIRMTGAAALPLYFKGANSALFHVLGLVHPRLRTAMLPHEFFNKKKPIELRLGAPVSARRCADFDSDEQLIDYLRHRTYLLQHRKAEAKPKYFLPAAPKQEPIAPAGHPELLRWEVEKLTVIRQVAELGDYSVLIVNAEEAPEILHEIARLREITFRKVGEGTGKALDRDKFDDHYLHLFVWQKTKHEIVGAYRLAPTEEIARRHGVKGLYTQTLFHFDSEFLDRLGPALELGRSFVRPEYQRDYQPLLLLWKGIGAYIEAHPEYKTLFGPVSISNDYLPASRQLMVNYFASRAADPLSRMVKARSPFKQKPVPGCRLAPDAQVWDIEELSTWIADMETDQKGVPILLRQYLKLGGKLLSFNVDAKFARAIDGLIVVDLTATDTRVLERYLGKAGAARFQTYHQRRSAS
jgi:putative hemolysin